MTTASQPAPSPYGGGLLREAALAEFQTSRSDAYRAEDTVLAFLVTFVGYLIARGTAEGLIDTIRSANGQVSKSDVGQ